MKFLAILFAFLVSLPVWAGTFRDDFEDGNLDGWSPSWWGTQPIWKVVNGTAECDRLDVMASLLIIGESGWSDYMIECDVKFKNLYIGVEYRYVEIFLRYLDANNFVYFNLADVWGNLYREQAFSSVYFAGQQNYKQDLGVPVDTDKWYHLKADATGNHFAFWVNNDKVADFEDSKIASGKIALGGGGSYFCFDNIVIAGPDIPNAGPSGFAVDSMGKLATVWGQIRN